MSRLFQLTIALVATLSCLVSKGQDRMAIAEVMTDVPVVNRLLTHGEDQFVAFYSPDHQMTIGHRKTDSNAWSFVKLPSVFGTDSHNYISIGVDRKGFVHVSGNMHANPLVYFKTQKPLDINSFEKVEKLTGDQETVVTYPEFLQGPDGALIFHYRSGWSGKGSEIFNVYDEETGTWRRLMDTPLADGLNKMNAYILGPDYVGGWYHLLWVWRDKPDIETCHDLCYARSKDLLHWESVFGESVELPMTIRDSCLLVDPVPVRSGLKNKSEYYSISADGTVLITYMKYDADGNSQLYLARPKGGSWEIKQISNWKYHWWFEGRGAINSEITFEPATFSGDGKIVVPYDHIEYGKGYLVVDAENLAPIEDVVTGQTGNKLRSQQKNINWSDTSIMKHLSAPDLSTPAGTEGRYHIEWKAWPANRDTAKTNFHPSPTTLWLIDKNATVLGPLPDKCDPVKVGKAVSEQFLTTIPEAYAPVGYDGLTPFGDNHWIVYATASLWVNAIEFASAVGDSDLEKRLIDFFEPYYTGGEKERFQRKANHVDPCVFGAIPLEIYLKNGATKALELGLRYADAQWAKPDQTGLSKNGNYDYNGQMKWLRKGYSPQTRLWIDDMYMITILQAQAYRATGDRKYIDRAGKEMQLYLKKLQNPDGLFYHAVDVPYVWGRGDGWVAAGMTLLLKWLPEDSPYRKTVLSSYRKMMAALLRWQREDGLWGQLVDKPDSWAETSGSAMFTYAFIEGVRNGWMDSELYLPAARKAWIALCDRLDEHGNLGGISEGTDRKNSMEWYLNRRIVNGDPHGQAPMLWICNALLSD